MPATSLPGPSGSVPQAVPDVPGARVDEQRSESLKAHVAKLCQLQHTRCVSAAPTTYIPVPSTAAIDASGGSAARLTRAPHSFPGAQPVSFTKASLDLLLTEECVRPLRRCVCCC